ATRIVAEFNCVGGNGPELDLKLVILKLRGVETDILLPLTEVIRPVIECCDLTHCLLLASGPPASSSWYTVSQPPGCRIGWSPHATSLQTSRRVFLYTRSGLQRHRRWRTPEPAVRARTQDLPTGCLGAPSGSLACSTKRPCLACLVQRTAGRNRPIDRRIPHH